MTCPDCNQPFTAAGLVRHRRAIHGAARREIQIVTTAEIAARVRAAAKRLGISPSQWAGQIIAREVGR